MVKLYKADLSPASRIAMMTLDAYGVSAELVDINLMAGENRTPEFLKKNPLHTIPVLELEDGNTHIHDSHAIQIYLAEAYGKDDSFYPKHAKQRAFVNQMLFFNSSFFFAQLSNVTSAAIREGQRKLNDKQKNGITEGYDYLEEFLSRNKYVAGSKISIADIACYATASSLNKIIPISSKYPKIQAWVKEMEKQSFSQKYNAPGVAIFGGFIGKMVRLYKDDFSPAARTVMMTLDIYGVSAELVDINVMNGENRTPEFLKKNPLHTVPVLEDGSFIIHDSHAIQIYLAETYGKDDSFYPKDAKQRALVNQMLFFNTSFFFPQAKNVIVPAVVENQRKLNDKQKNGIIEGYDYLEEFLSRNKYVAGSKISIADISCFANATSLNKIIPVSSKYPKIQAWIKEMEKQSFSQKFNAPGVAVYGEIVAKLMDL